MRSAYPPDASYWVFVAPLLVQGVAMGMFFVALLTISLDRLPPERIPAAAPAAPILVISSASWMGAWIRTSIWSSSKWV
jgi:MFS transporter, DHA2 family, multidrug resistance protein